VTTCRPRANQLLGEGLQSVPCLTLDPYSTAFEYQVSGDCRSVLDPILERVITGAPMKMLYLVHVNIFLTTCGINLLRTFHLNTNEDRITAYVVTLCYASGWRVTKYKYFLTMLKLFFSPSNRYVMEYNFNKVLTLVTKSFLFKVIMFFFRYYRLLNELFSSQYFRF